MIYHMHTDPSPRCSRCHRPLRSAASRAAGIGAVCARRVRQDEAAAAFTPQVHRAAEMDIEDGAVVAVRRTTRTGHRVFAVLSATPDRDGHLGSYLTTVAACTCPAGLAGRVCHHRAAVVLLAA